MPRLIKRKQLDIKNQEAPKGKYGVEDNRVNIKKGDKMELSFDKISVLLDGRNIIQLDQIWADSNLIPESAKEIPGLIKFVNNLELSGLPGHTSTYRSSKLKNIIPENFGDKISYKWIIRDFNNNIIDLKKESGYIDPLSGTLTFINGNPSNVSHSKPPKITCYQYIGNTALDTGLGKNVVPGIPSNSKWQDPVIDFIEILPIFPTLGDRYIYNGTSFIQESIIEGDELITDNIEPDDIIEYSSTTSGTSGISLKGWSIFRPTSGTFTSVTSKKNTIYFWRTVNRWQPYQNEKTFPIEQELKTQDTFIKNGTNSYSHIISDTKISKDATPNTDWTLFVNGIKINDNIYDFVNVNKEENAVYNSTSGTSGSNIEFNGSYTINVGDLVKINTNNGVIWRTIININNGVISYSGPEVSNITNANLYTYQVVNGNFPVKGSRILLKDGLSYDIESGDFPDSISIHYVIPSNS